MLLLQARFLQPEPGATSSTVPLAGGVAAAVHQLVQREIASGEGRASAIVRELGPLIMSDRVVLDNLRGPGLEAVLRRIDAVSEAGFTYLAWMLKRVDGAEKRELVDLLLGGVSAPELRGRLVVVCARDLGSHEYDDERLLVTLVERMSDSDVFRYVVSAGASVEAAHSAVHDPALQQRIDERIRTYTVAVSRGIEQRALAELGEMASARARAEPARFQQVILAGLDQQGDIAVAMQDLRTAYEWRYHHEAPTPEARERLRREFRDQIHLLRDTYREQFEMGLRFGVLFTTARGEYLYSRQEQLQLFRRRFWSRQELARIAAVLQRVPRPYLSRVRRIAREPGVGSSAGASWDEGDGTLRIYNRGFELDDDRLELAVLHEIGHSTMPLRTQGSFRSLPNSDWMILSDWRMSTRASLGGDVGIGGQELQDVLAAIDRQISYSAGIHPPVYANGRAIVWDKYEPNPGRVPSQFFSYDARFDNQFVSPYARRHPAEDFAESFAQFMRDPAAARRILDRGEPGTMDKWDFLARRYPERLAARGR